MVDQLGGLGDIVGIDVGKPKDLFRRHQRLGVYTWQNVYQTAKKSIETDAMALRFVDTEVFPRPETGAEYRAMGIKANFESPLRINEGIFQQIDRLGSGHIPPA